MSSINNLKNNTANALKQAGAKAALSAGNLKGGAAYKADQVASQLKTGTIKGAASSVASGAKGLANRASAQVDAKSAQASSAAKTNLLNPGKAAASGAANAVSGAAKSVGSSVSGAGKAVAASAKYAANNPAKTKQEIGKAASGAIKSAFKK